MSYGVNAPQGLQPYSDITGTPWNNQSTQYNIISGLATNIFTGDPVIFDGAGGITVATAGSNPTLGVFVGCKYLLNGTYAFSPYWPSGTVASNAVAFVIDDPNVVFNIQAGGAGTPAVILSDFGNNVPFHAGAGSTTSGQSGFYLDSANFAGTSTLNLKVLAFTPVPGNPTPTVRNGTQGSFNNALVIINNHVYKGGTGTAGI